MSDPLAGKLLVATPKLQDPNFARAVVLLLTHDERGSFGLVLNRPAEAASVAEHLPLWSRRVAAPPLLFLGGPVEQTSALGLARRGAVVPAPGWKPFEGELGLIDLNLDPGDITGELEKVRIFMGYAGWGAGQLEEEIAQDAWFVVAARAGDVFSDDPDALWGQVLARQKGRLAMFAHFPTDPRAN